MKVSAVAYVVSLVVFLALDAVWLGLVAQDFYQSQVGALMRDPPNLVAAAVFYPMFVVGIVIFVILPALESQRESLTRVIVLGGLYGLFAYGTYDLTNLATIRGWTLPMVLVDMGWGFVVTASSSAGGYAAARAFGR